MIKLARVEHGLTQTDLAEKLEMSISSVAAYERGERPRFSRRMASALEEALGITDRRLLIALGYEPAPRSSEGRHSLSYEGAELGPQQEREVLEYIEWVRGRNRR
jgi:transcriptional regulator with XRE-family HTH domain